MRVTATKTSIQTTIVVNRIYFCIRKRKQFLHQNVNHLQNLPFFYLKTGGFFAFHKKKKKVISCIFSPSLQMTKHFLRSYLVLHPEEIKLDCKTNFFFSDGDIFTKPGLLKGSWSCKFKDHRICLRAQWQTQSFYSFSQVILYAFFSHKLKQGHVRK